MHDLSYDQDKCSSIVLISKAFASNDVANAKYFDSCVGSLSAKALQPACKTLGPLCDFDTGPKLLSHSQRCRFPASLVAHKDGECDSRSREPGSWHNLLGGPFQPAMLPFPLSLGGNSQIQFVFLAITSSFFGCAMFPSIACGCTMPVSSFSFGLFYKPFI